MYAMVTRLSVEWTVEHWEEVVKEDRLPATEWFLGKLPMEPMQAVFSWKRMRLEDWFSKEDIYEIHDTKNTLH